MKTASIISIGNEVISGQTVDTNAAFLSSELLNVNVPVVGCYAVGDDIERIVRAMKLASEDSDIILVTGGLGPTDDDITREAFGKFFSVELKLHSELIAKVKSFFDKRGVAMPEKNISQAYLPQGASAVENNFGTAPGMMMKKGGKLFFAMPGVPSEMKAMFERNVLPQIQKILPQQSIVVKKLKLFGAGESAIAQRLGDLMSRSRNPLINCTVSFGVITLHIIGTSQKQRQAQQMVEEDEKLLRNMFGELVYGSDDQSLAEVVGKELTAGKKTVATAESCTGGLVAKLFTDIPGSSAYFMQGWVTYSNSSKTQLLDVSADLIERYGAVSEEVATEMAKNARKIAGTDYSIAVTGIAGPGGGTEQKPVGLVYVSIDSQKGCRTEKFIFSHEREFMRIRAAQTAINLLRLQL